MRPVCRWGNAKSPAYGTLSDYQFMRRHSCSGKWLETARSAWGSSLSSVDDVIKVFVNYCSGGFTATACVADQTVQRVPFMQLPGCHSMQDGIAAHGWVLYILSHSVCFVSKHPSPCSALHCQLKLQLCDAGCAAHFDALLQKFVGVAG